MRKTTALPATDNLIVNQRSRIANQKENLQNIYKSQAKVLAKWGKRRRKGYLRDLRKKLIWNSQRMQIQEKQWKFLFGHEKRFPCEALKVDWRLACQIKILCANKTAYNVSDKPEIKTSGTGILTDVVLQKLPVLYSLLDVQIWFTSASVQDNIWKGTLKNAALFAKCLVHYSSGKASISEQHYNRCLSYGV